MTETCPECNHTIVNNGSSAICNTCGLIISQDIDLDCSYSIVKDEKNIFSLECTNIFNNLGTFIDHKDTSILKDFRSRPLCSQLSETFLRIKKRFEKSSYLYKYDLEYRISNSLDKVCEMLHINKEAQKQSFQLFLKIVKSKDIEIINNTSLIATCLYYTLIKSRNISIPFSKLFRAFQSIGHRVNFPLIRRDLFQYNRYFPSITRPRSTKSELIDNYVATLLKSEQFISYYEKKNVSFELSFYGQKIKEIAKLLLNKIGDSGHNIRNLCTALIYYSDNLFAKKYKCKRPLTQSILCNVTNVRDYSMRDVYNNFLKPYFRNKIIIKQK